MWAYLAKVNFRALRRAQSIKPISNVMGKFFAVHNWNSMTLRNRYLIVVKILAQFGRVRNYWCSPASSPDSLLARRARRVGWQGYHGQYIDDCLYIMTCYFLEILVGSILLTCDYLCSFSWHYSSSTWHVFCCLQYCVVWRNFKFNHTAGCFWDNFLFWTYLITYIFMYTL